MSLPSGARPGDTRNIVFELKGEVIIADTATLLQHLAFLYGKTRSPELAARLEGILSHYRAPGSPPGDELTEHDSILITYPDQIQSPHQKPLQTLGAFCRAHLPGIMRGIHILPFYPSTSDDGFSVADYRQVDPDWGTWEDIEILQQDFRLMFDAVINHVSSQSAWFQSFLADQPPYRDYFITLAGSPDLSRVVRPRTLPLLTPFATTAGVRQVWTTFSADQIDLDYHNPDVLFEILAVLLKYVEHGAAFIRLDAVAYLWKEPGTPCIHLPQAHRIIQFLRAVLDQAAPHVKLITETNVPHTDNLSYFGDGMNEAQLIYNFALPPLVLHTFHRGEAGTLSKWAEKLSLPSSRTTFFNILASHDGIGLTPVTGILTGPEINDLVEKTIVHGGRISYKNEADGSQSPYELNINYFDALSNPQKDEPLELQVDRFMAAQAILLSMPGVPGIYFHSLFGSRGWPDGVRQTGHNRTINRQKLSFDALQKDLADSISLRARVFKRYKDLLKTRSSLPAFHPHGSQEVVHLHPAVFAVERRSPDGTSRAVCLHNVSNKQIRFTMEYKSGLNLHTGRTQSLTDIALNPYQILWVTP